MSENEILDRLNRTFRSFVGSIFKNTSNEATQEENNENQEVINNQITIMNNNSTININVNQTTDQMNRLAAAAQERSLNLENMESKSNKVVKSAKTFNENIEAIVEAVNKETTDIDCNGCCIIA